MENGVDPDKFRFSFSHWENYSQCPRRWKFKNVDCLPTAPVGPAAQRGTIIHGQCDAYVMNESDKVPDIDFHLDVLEDLRNFNGDKGCEDKVEYSAAWEILPKKSADTHYVLIFDAWRVNDGTLEIFEWKTGKPKDSHQDQRKFYITGGFAKYDFQNIEATTYYLDGTEGPQNTKAKRSAQPTLIKLWKDRRELMLEDNFYPPRTGFHCRWCDFSRLKKGPCPVG